MSQESKRKELEQDVNSALEHIKRPALTPALSSQEWEQLVDASDRTPEEKQKLKELGRFLSLKQYFEDQGQMLEPVIIEGYLELHNFSLPTQIKWLSRVNQKLMEQMDAGSRA